MNFRFKPYQFLIVLLFGLSTVIVEAQEERSNFWSHVQYGGGLGLSFGDGFFSGTIAPSAIYRFNDRIATGIGLSGTYISEKNFYNSAVIGASSITLFNVIREIQLSAEFEEYYVTRNFDDDLLIEDDDYWVPALFFGIGFQTQNVTMGIRYDVLYDSSKSVYANAYVPFVRFYF
jgi:hypothetical protein